jgi:hypothetical protein
VYLSLSLRFFLNVKYFFGKLKKKIKHFFMFISYIKIILSGCVIGTPGGMTGKGLAVI